MPLINSDTQLSSILEGKNFKIGKNSTIKGDYITIGHNVSIGDNVEIVCDKLVLGDGCKIGNGSLLLCPEIDLADRCSIGNNVQCELNEYLRLGSQSAISNRVTIAGQGVKSGVSLWLKNDVIIGGGGSQGPRSYLELGDCVAVMDKAFINLSEEVSIGDYTALSFGVVILTHGAAQPLLMGYSAKFAPVKIGAQCNVYINSVILPGITIGNYSTIGACSLVNKDIPAYALATGNPARIIVKGEGNYPRPLEQTDIDELLHGILTDYAATLIPKGLKAVVLPGNPFALNILYQQQSYSVMYFGEGRSNLPQGMQPDISMSYIDLEESLKGKVHFDLKELKVLGDPGLLAEDLRDYLRRRAIRIYNDRAFRNIPLTNLARLKEKRKTNP